MSPCRPSPWTFSPSRVLSSLMWQEERCAPKVVPTLVPRPCERGCDERRTVRWGEHHGTEGPQRGRRPERETGCREDAGGSPRPE